MKTIILWYRNDLRIHDHPALSKAARDADRIVPVFILNDGLLHGTHGGSNRNRFLIECLDDLRGSLRERDGDLIVRSGKPELVLAELAHEVQADAVYYTADFTPYALARDKRVAAALDKQSVEFRGFAGRLVVSSLQKLHTKSGATYKVFTPFWKSWMEVQRRDLASAPTKVHIPTSVTIGSLPKQSDITDDEMLSPDVLRGGESAGRKRLKAFLKSGIDEYHETNNDMAADATSRLSSYFHFGCISVREAETLLPQTSGARAWRRQLAWRDFYHYILLHNPSNATKEFQEKYRTLTWDSGKKTFIAWTEGKTGYPIVDAAMRQLRAEGWMHNRGRLIVGSFLTKDLWLDWRRGESHFMRYLTDGDEANNNGNWQWIASVGVDPAPVYRRLYNPSSQAKKFDPSGAYIRRYVPELARVPDKYLAEPWTMPETEQQSAGCIIGADYPEPIVDHKQARAYALEQYRSV